MYQYLSKEIRRLDQQKQSILRQADAHKRKNSGNSTADIQSHLSG